MIFSSWQFIFIFFPLALLGFFAIPARFLTARKLWLTLASFVFYGYWKLEYVPLILFSIGLNYLLAESMLRFHGRTAAWWLLVIAIALNLLLLGYYKYANFVASTFGLITQHHFARFDIILPLAISFFTFTQIAYLVDVYRDQARHCRFLDYTLFVVLFPHLIAGPIVRHWEIIPQFARGKLRPNRSDMMVGVSLFILGLSKKILLADSISGVADAVFRAADNGICVTLFDAWLGVLAFAFQIYFDFSGYSDMAIGLARIFSLTFPCNFNSPYQASSITEFWKRWHITLTRFMREYLYFPLGGNRCSPIRHGINLMLTMLASGLWHGAGWTYVVWGGFHGALLVIHHAWSKRVKEMRWNLDFFAYRMASVIATFMAILFGWVLFRASSFKVAQAIFASMLGLNGLTVPYHVGEAALGIGRMSICLGANIVHVSIQGLSYHWSIHIIIALACIVWLTPNSQQLLAQYSPILEPVSPSPHPLTLSLGLRAGLFFGILFFLAVRTFLTAKASPFIYFNF